MKPTIGFFGLGAMGYPMAGRLARGGFGVAVADPVVARVDAWCTEFGAAAHHPAEADVVVTCVTDAAVLRELLAGPDRLLGALRRGTLVVDHTTATPALARELAAQAAPRGVGFVDAPMSGGVESTGSGTLVVMAGGAAADLARARPVLEVYAAQIVHVGPTGSGQLAKLVNQIAIAGTVRALAEGITLARAGGVDPARVLEALAGGTANSAQLARTRDALAAPGFDFAATFGWLAKDLRLAAEEGRRAGAPVPLVELVLAHLEERR
jgi:3-hydroxyisobutyrate dehydrogenase-like beta-hydroxyacid dehydrogenase